MGGGRSETCPCLTRLNMTCTYNIIDIIFQYDYCMHMVRHDAKRIQFDLWIIGG